MERILVGIDSQETDLAPGIHAVNLAKRIQAKVFFLLVNQPGAQKPDSGKENLVSRLERLISHARSEGLPVEYFVSEGPFESETIRFIQENAVNLLVVGQPRNGGETSQRKFHRTLENIRLRVDCRIEVVNQRDQSMHTEGK